MSTFDEFSALLDRGLALAKKKGVLTGKEDSDAAISIGFACLMADAEDRLIFQDNIQGSC